MNRNMHAITDLLFLSGDFRKLSVTQADEWADVREEEEDGDGCAGGEFELS